LGLATGPGSWAPRLLPHDLGRAGVTYGRGVPRVLPIDILKLDRSFVAELDGTTGGSAVATAVLRLGEALQLQTVAEGVESASQAQELTLLGCQLAQGFHFARPMPAAALQAVLDGVTPTRPATSAQPH
jgi:sensor c-di-GMP phosphodiesterase-like protein